LLIIIFGLVQSDHINRLYYDLYRFANGDVYEGEFKENVPFGKGKYTYKDGGADEANWEHGVRHGLARYNSIDGTVEEVFCLFLTWQLYRCCLRVKGFPFIVRM